MTKKAKKLISLLLVLVMMLALLPTTALAASKPVITTQPTNKLGAPGGKVTFSIKATGATSYQWQYRKAGSSVWANSPAEGNQTPNLKVSVEKYKDGYFYRCKVINSAGVVVSNAVKLNVNKPVIQTHPTAKAGAPGSTVTFTVKANAATSYQWQYRTSATGTWQNSPATGNKTANLKVAVAASKNGYFYRCKVSNGCGSVISNAAKLTVTSGTKYRALLIGNQNYETVLDGTHNDMYNMQGMLKSMKGNWTVTIKPDQTAAQMKSAISTAFAGATANDVSLFYYSGHGMGSSGSSIHGALVGVHYGNYSYSDYYSDYLTSSALATALSKVPGRVIVILDSCHSGAVIGKGFGEDSDEDIASFNQSFIDAFADRDAIIGGDSIERVFDPETGEYVSREGELATSKFIVFTACKSSQTSSSVTTNGGWWVGLFTYFFVRGTGSRYTNYTYSNVGEYMGSIPCDTNGDSKISVIEIYNYAKTNALNYGSQIAQYYASNQNEIIFKR